MTPSVENSPASAAVDATPLAALAPDEGAEDVAAEAAAWAEVVAAWGDEARHRAYLARFQDLEGLAAAGGRYRAVLEERPDDAVAARFREEVLRRAVAHGLASLPRAADRSRAKLAFRLAAFAVVGGLVGFVGFLAVRLLVGWGASP